MNAEKVLTWTTAALGHLNGSGYFNTINILEGMKAEAEAEIRRDAAKQSGNASRQKAAERVIKCALSDPHEALHGAWNANDKQHICDGFRIYSFINPLPLQALPKKSNLSTWNVL